MKAVVIMVAWNALILEALWSCECPAVMDSKALDAGPCIELAQFSDFPSAISVTSALETLSIAAKSIRFCKEPLAFCAFGAWDTSVIWICPFCVASRLVDAWAVCCLQALDAFFRTCIAESLGSRNAVVFIETLVADAIDKVHLAKGSIAEISIAVNVPDFLISIEAVSRRQTRIELSTNIISGARAAERAPAFWQELAWALCVFQTLLANVGSWVAVRVIRIRSAVAVVSALSADSCIAPAICFGVEMLTLRVVVTRNTRP